MSCSTGATPNLENAIFLHRRFLTKQCIFDLISDYDGQIYGEYNENAKGIYYKVVPYCDKVLNNVRKGIKNDLVTNNVTKLAYKIKTNSNTLLDLPPIIIVNGGFCDGSHRLSAIHLLSEFYDSDNFRWNRFRLKVDFYAEMKNKT